MFIVVKMYRRTVTQEIEEIARIELNETPKIRVETLEHIEDWIKKQPFINFRTDGLWLLNFIRGCKFSTQKTKQKIEAYLKAKEMVPELLLNKDPMLPPLQDMLKNGSMIPFGTPDKECVVVRWETLNPNKVYFSDIVKLATMLLDLFMNESDTCMVVGHYAIIDCKGFSLSFMAQLTPLHLKRILYNIISAYPLRIKSICFINCVAGIESVYNLSKSFLSTKIQNRISFYGENYEGIYESIPKKYFPKEYGGCAGSLDELTDVWKKKVESCRQWFLDQSNCSIGNNKKTSVLNGETTDYSIEGSFRKLDFD